MNLRDARILNARKKATTRPCYCNPATDVHVNCEHGSSMLSTEQPAQQKTRARSTRRHASRAEQYARYLDCGPTAWDDRDGGE